MSRNSQRNRAARKRKQNAGPRKRRERSDEYELLSAGMQFGFGPSADAESLRSVAAQLPAFDFGPTSLSRPNPVLPMVDSLLDFVFESGWQPAELAHAVRREIGNGPLRLLGAMLTAHARRTSAHTAAPDAWRQQLIELGIADADGSTAEQLGSWHSSEELDDVDAWCTLLTLMGYLQYLMPLKPLIPVPSAWGSVNATPKQTRVTDTKILTRIRGLLAKAEATTFAAEAETLSAKAQDLMTRYAIDSAVLDAHSRTSRTSLADEVTTRRLIIDNPYPEAKVSLLHSVAESNGARVLWHQSYGLASMVGMPVDLDLCELLFTSLLVQATHAMTETGSTRSTRSPSFRRSFLLAFASRVGQRLAEARARAQRDASSQYGNELVPILTERTEAVGSIFDAQFPSVHEVAQSIGNTAGWRAGQIAAEGADLTGGRESLSREVT